MAIPLKDSELLSWANNFAARISTTGNPYAVPTDLRDEIGDANNTFATVYAALMTARADGTLAKSQTAQKDAAKSTLLAAARQAYGMISANDSISDADKILAGVHVRVSPSPVPAPTARPGMDIMSVVGRTISIHVHDSASSVKRGKPAGAVQALVYYFAGEDYPSDPNGWSFAGPTTKAKFEFTVPDDVAGGTRVWICAAWTNRGGDPGPVNVPVSTNIQGGGTTASASMKIAA